MADSEYERLRKRVEDGVQAAEELQRLLAKTKRQQRPKLRLIKGGILGGAIWAGVEWLRDYKRIAAAATAAGVAVVAVVIAEQPHSPGAGPPPGATPTRVTPVTPRPTPRPIVTPTPSVPPRTSPLRTPADIGPTPAPTATTAPRATPSPPRTRARAATPTVFATEAELTVTPTLPVSPVTDKGCVAADLIEVKPCPRLG